MRIRDWSSDVCSSDLALADYVTRNIQNSVSRVPGVGQFQLFAAPRAMRIWVDPDKLVGYGLSMSDVNAAINQQNVLISGGILGSPPNPDGQRVPAPIVVTGDRKSTRLNSSHLCASRRPSSALK